MHNRDPELEILHNTVCLMLTLARRQEAYKTCIARGH